MPPGHGPRRWSTTPKRFGRVRNIVWLRGATGAEADIRAAMHQHNLVMTIRHLMQERAILSDAALARAAGLSTSQIERFMRGEAAFTLKALAQIEIALNVDLIRPPGIPGPPKPEEPEPQ